MAIFNYSNEEPQFVTCDRHLGQKVYTINFNIEEIEDEEQYGQRYRYCSVTLPVGRYDRSAVISAIIRHRYDDDKMQAIINNYLLDKGDVESVMEFDAMQEYRKFAKKIADMFLETISEQP